MFNLVKDLLMAISRVVSTERENLIFTLLILRKQNEILKRHIDFENERLHPSHKNRWSLAMIAAISKTTISHLQVFKPKTVFTWQRKFITGLSNGSFRTSERKERLRYQVRGLDS
jgi:hypothetical protein